MLLRLYGNSYHLSIGQGYYKLRGTGSSVEVEYIPYGCCGRCGRACSRGEPAAQVIESGMVQLYHSSQTVSPVYGQEIGLERRTLYDEDADAQFLGCFHLLGKSAGSAAFFDYDSIGTYLPYQQAFVFSGMVVTQIFFGECLASRQFA